MFVDWKNQYCENEYTTKSNLQIQCNPYQTTNSIFHRTKIKNKKKGKLSSDHRTGKGQFSFQSQRKAKPKNVQTTAQLHSSHASKVILKIF